MNTALAFFLHALRMVFRNLPETLRATWPGLVIMFFGSIGVLWVSNTHDLGTTTLETESASNWPAFAIIFAGYLLGSVITAIFWHRYVLLDGSNNTAPPFSTNLVLSYISRVLKIAVVTILCLIPAVIVVLVVATTAEPVTFVQFLMPIFLNWLGTYLLYRFALGLPGVCIGDDIGVTDSYRQTKSLAIPLLWLAALSGLLSTIMTWAEELIPLPKVIGIPLNTGLFFLQALIGASILTALYGHLIAGRSLPGLPTQPH